MISAIMVILVVRTLQQSVIYFQVGRIRRLRHSLTFLTTICLHGQCTWHRIFILYVPCEKDPSTAAGINGCRIYDMSELFLAKFSVFESKYLFLFIMFCSCYFFVGNVAFSCCLQDLKSMLLKRAHCSSLCVVCFGTEANIYLRCSSNSFHSGTEIGRVSSSLEINILTDAPKKWYNGNVNFTTIIHGADQCKGFHASVKKLML